MNLQSFKTSPREITFGRLLKSQYELLPFGTLCNLIAKMHNTSKFWLIKFMDANYSIYDRFIQRQPCACMRVFVNFFLKKNSQKLLTGFLPNFTGIFLRQRLKTSLHCYRKIRPVERYRRSSAELENGKFQSSMGNNSATYRSRVMKISHAQLHHLCRNIVCRF